MRLVTVCAVIMALGYPHTGALGWLILIVLCAVLDKVMRDER